MIIARLSRRAPPVQRPSILVATSAGAFAQLAQREQMAASGKVRVLLCRFRLPRPFFSEVAGSHQRGGWGEGRVVEVLGSWRLGTCLSLLRDGSLLVGMQGSDVVLVASRQSWLGAHTCEARWRPGGKHTSSWGVAQRRRGNTTSGVTESLSSHPSLRVVRGDLAASAGVDGFVQLRTACSRKELEIESLPPPKTPARAGPQGLGRAKEEANHRQGSLSSSSSLARLRRAGARRWLVLRALRVTRRDARGDWNALLYHAHARPYAASCPFSTLVARSRGDARSPVLIQRRKSTSIASIQASQVDTAWATATLLTPNLARLLTAPSGSVACGDLMRARTL